MEEDFDLLHNKILESSDTFSSDDFWKGNPPTWADLHQQRDLPRSLVHGELCEAIDTKSRTGKTETIIFSHSPGAGGSTAALRVAWDYKGQFPTVVIRRYTQRTPDRLADLSYRSGSTLLIIGDAPNFTEDDREKLFNSLAERHIRAVIVHVVRTIARHAKQPALLDPMPHKELNEFLAEFIARTDDPLRKSELRRLVGDKSYETYRSPFFFGLITYEEEYQGVKQYVASCLSGCGYTLEQALRYLAVVTKYSQVGIPESVLAILLKKSVPAPDSPVSDLLGDGPARLAVRQASDLRLRHAVIAEQTLRKLAGGGTDQWIANLTVLAIDFISALRRTFGDVDASSKELLEALFIRRADPEREVGSTFSPLIDAIKTPEGQQEVFATLTGEFPRFSHFWNHRARHLVYRLGRGYEDAVGFMEKAVSLERVAAHYQTYGQILRLWAIDEMKLSMAEIPKPTVADVFDKGIEKIEAAFEKWKVAQRKQPDSTFPFVSRVQLTIDVVQILRTAAGEGVTLEDLMSSAGPVKEWLEARLPEAEDCIESLQNLRSSGKSSMHARKVEGRLDEVYGDFDAMVRLWESLIAREDDSAAVRRNLAGAYLARGGRDWSNVSENELGRIVEMVGRNLQDDPTSVRDLRLWFNAYRRLPSFRIDYAIERLSSWARDRFPEAQYYLYILYFLVWRSNPAVKTERLVRDNLEKSTELAREFQIRRDFSFEWLGNEPAWCPLVDQRTLGPMQSSSADGQIFQDVSKLIRVSGFTVPGFQRQGGEIKIGGSSAIKAFFVPPPDLYSYKDENKEVNFYLGFGYGEIHAWDVRISTPAPREIRREEKKEFTEPDEVTISLPSARVDPVRTAEIRADSDERLRREIQQKAIEIATVYARTSRNLSLSALGEELTLAFPRVFNKIPVAAGYSNLTAMIADNAKLTIEETSGLKYIRLKTLGRVS